MVGDCGLLVASSFALVGGTFFALDGAVPAREVRDSEGGTVAGRKLPSAIGA